MSLYKAAKGWGVDWRGPIRATPPQVCGRRRGGTAHGCGITSSRPPRAAALATYRSVGTVSMDTAIDLETHTARMRPRRAPSSTNA